MPEKGEFFVIINVMFKPVTPNVNFPEMEKKILDWWYSSGIVEKYLQRNNKSPKRFSFLDGPITANNPMGVHHAWGRTYKDLWQKFYNMRGFRQRFQNGFDCQGLWVEVEVEKELGFKSKKDIENFGVANFVNKCKERVRKYSAIQTEQSKRLGFFMDWDNSYYTMSDENNYMIWYMLKECHKRGWIYKGHESIPWCPRCETAISQHEILTEDYKEVIHESIYLKLPIVGRNNEYLLIWTTTPWTIPANIAVAVDAKLYYSLVKTDSGDKIWIAKDLVEKVLGKKDLTLLNTVKGKELAGLKYQGPFDDLPRVKDVAGKNSQNFHTVVMTDPLLLQVTTTEGTGLVHTAVSAGEEDFKLGKKLGLPMIPVIADNADYLPDLGSLSGKNAKKNPRVVLDFLDNEKWSLRIENYKHRYPACWRCKTELAWKVADEWYIAMDRPSRKASGGKVNNKTLREQMIEVAKKIKWLPAFGLDRELDWLKNMHDWLISKKNRYWGLALPIYECNKCGNFELIGRKEELKKRAISGWDKFEGNSPHKPWIDEVKIKCQKCGSIVERIKDVGNPWLDAGIVSFSTLIDPLTQKLSYTADKKYWQDWFPADFITEGFAGQFKNWFYSLIVMGTVLENTNPFKTVLGYGTLLAEDGRPMHKSWGNAVEFNEGADKIGVDVMRWMYATCNPEDNLLFGYKKADETRRKFHLLLWNIYNFFVTYANIDKYQKSQPKADQPRAENILDQWILAKLYKLISTVTDSLEKYDPQTASLSIESFVTDLSQWFVRRSRDRIGPTVDEGPDKNNCYNTLYSVLTTLCKLSAPFVPFIAEEIYRNLTDEESVHLTEWPKEISNIKNQKSKIIEEMEFVRKVCELGHAKRKELGIKVRQPLAKLQIVNSKLQIDKELKQLIRDELNIKEVEIKTGDGELAVELDTKLTSQLIAEGQARELARQIQLKRKELGCNLTEKIKISLPDWPLQYADYIKRETLSVEIKKADILSVSRL